MDEQPTGPAYWLWVVTPEMLAAGREAIPNTVWRNGSVCEADLKAIYRAMVKLAPKWYSSDWQGT